MLLGRAATLALAPELARASPAGAFAAELLDALDAEAADVLVIDFMLAGAIAAAERTRLPTAALMHTVYRLTAPGRPPFGAALAPRSGINPAPRSTPATRAPPSASASCRGGFLRPGPISAASLSTIVRIPQLRS